MKAISLNRTALIIVLGLLAGCASRAPTPVSGEAPPPPALVAPPIKLKKGTPPYGVEINNEGLALAQQGRHVDAVPLFREALDALPAKDPANALSRAAVLNNYGASLTSLEQLDDARQAFAEAVALREAAAGALAAPTLLSRHNLGVVLGRLGQGRAACEQAVLAWRGRNQTLGPVHPDTVASLQSMRSMPGCGG